jgi:catechol 2,3-dioxygenase-like lactoylglutathione lyase family enzyme
MEEVTGTGGFFFRARDPDALSIWYRERLGIAPVPSSYDDSPWRQQAGPTAFAPFPETTEYFGDPGKSWMINFRVTDLDAMVPQLREAGITVEVDAQSYPNGRFARLHDPEGNPIELWEPVS